jgi:hypothetical protein
MIRYVLCVVLANSYKQAGVESMTKVSTAFSRLVQCIILTQKNALEYFGDFAFDAKQ